MIFSKNPSTRILLALLALSASCSRNSTPIHSQESDDATFLIENPVKLVQSQKLVSDSAWSIPTRNQMTLRACLKDVAKLDAIIYQKFAVYGENGRQEISTDAEGCLTWNETIDFDYSKPETFVQGDRAIEGLGPHQGKRNLPIAVDPWLNNDDAISDLREKPQLARLIKSSSIREGLTAMSEAQVSSESSAHLFLDSVSFPVKQTRYSMNGGKFSYQLVLQPMLARNGLQGVEVREPITSGLFNVDVSLIEVSSKDDRRYILSSTSVPNARADHGQILLNLDMDLERLPSANSTFEVALKLSAVNPPFAIASENGKVSLENSLSGSATLEHLGSSLDNYVSEAMNNSIALNALMQSQSVAKAGDTSGASSGQACQDGSDQLGFFISSVDVEHKGVTGRTSNENVPNEVTASYNVCLGNSLTRGSIADQTFEVQLTDANGSGRAAAPQTLQTTNGCLRFTAPVSFDYFAPEHWIQKKLVVTSHEAPFKELSRTYSVLLDPWSTSHFFWNCQNGAQPELKTEPARLEMIDFNYSFSGRDLEIDPLLNLTLKRHYLVHITPRLKRSTGFDGPAYESLTDGKYHLSVILLSPNHDEYLNQIASMSTEDVIQKFKYMSSYSADITTRDGLVVEDVVLPIAFADTPILTARAAIIVKLTPISADSRLIAHPFFAPFLPMEDFGMLTLLSDQSSSASAATPKQKMLDSGIDLDRIASIGKLSKEKIQLKSLTLKDSIAKRFGVTIATGDTLSRYGLDESAVKSITTNEKLSVAHARKLCRLLGSKSPDSCAQNPATSLEIVRTHHVEAVSKTPDVLASDIQSMSVSANLSINESADESISKGDSATKSEDTHRSANASTGVGFDFFGFFKAGGDISTGKGWSNGKSWYQSHSESQSKSGSGSSSLSRTRSFSVEQLTLGITAGVRSCATMRLKNSKSKGTMICESESQGNKSMSESFILMTEANAGSSSPLRDARTLKEKPWMRAIRGRKAFDALVKVMTDRTKTIVLSPDKINEDGLFKLDDALDQFAKTRPDFSDGAFPSVIY